MFVLNKAVPFQAPLNTFFLLPFEKRNIEMSGSIPEDAMEACIMLQNGPVFETTTALPFYMCLLFPENGRSLITMKSWWNSWNQVERIDSSDWLKPGQNFTMKVNFREDSAQVSLVYVLATFISTWKPVEIFLKRIPIIINKIKMFLGNIKIVSR